MALTLASLPAFDARRSTVGRLEQAMARQLSKLKLAGRLTGTRLDKSLFIGLHTALALQMWPTERIGSVTIPAASLGDRPMSYFFKLLNASLSGAKQEELTGRASTSGGGNA